MDVRKGERKRENTKYIFVMIEISCHGPDSYGPHLNPLSNKTWLEQTLQHHFDLHVLSRALSHKWNDSEWQCDVLSGTIPV